MATSGTYTFNPSLGELTLYAYNLVGVRNTALLQEHLEAARMATNLLLSRWSNQGVNLWAVDKVVVPVDQTPVVTGCSGTGTIATLTYASVDTPVYTVGETIVVSGMVPSIYNGTHIVTASSPGSVSYASTAIGALAQGGIIQSEPGTVSTFSVDPNTVVILDAYMTDPSSGAVTDRIILPISRTEYASYPNKQQQGFPTVFWFDRLLAPTVTLWPVPYPPQGPAALTYYRVRRIQDASMGGAQTVEIPYLWLEAFAYALAQRLALIWAPEKVALFKPLADEAYQIAADQNIETAQQYISPQIAGYYR
jgi:hypothetical protein